MKRIFPLFILLLSSLTWAQDAPSSSDSPSNNEFWQANLPGGNYIVSLGSITSVSNHAYILDGAVVVTEVTIDTTGSTVARFYQLTPLPAYTNSDIAGLFSEGLSELKNLTSEITGAGNQDASKLVQKKYPQTTHAKTVEYQIESLSQLSALFRSASTAWMRGSGRTFSIR